jgi:hypothetical protein
MQLIKSTFDIYYVFLFLILGRGRDNPDSGHLCEPYRKRFLCGQLPTTQRQVRSFKRDCICGYAYVYPGRKEARKVKFVLLS